MKLNKRIGKALMFFAFALIVIVSVMGLSSCGMAVVDVQDITVINTEINDAGDLIIYFSDGSYHNVGKLSNNEYNVSMSGQGENVSAATALGLMSAVSIQSNFVSKTQTYIPGFGIIGGSGNQYYSCGSGVIYRLNGEEALIITNHHVVYDSGSRMENGIGEKIDVFLYGREDDQYAISAEYVGGSQYYDIAVLRAKDAAFASGAVRAVDIAEGEVTVGQTAIAVGNPQGYGISASLGIVSVDSEYIVLSETNTTTRVIRVDTAVNAGNSGGGLYNGRGELVGIVNAKIIDDSVENIGYAIPTAVAISVADNIIDNCLNKQNTAVKRVMLGINFDSAAATTVINEDGGVEIRESVVVTTIEKNSLAAGVLQKGDILLNISVRDKSLQITRRYHVIDFMLCVRAGDTITITFLRNSEEITKTITVNSSAVYDY